MNKWNECADIPSSSGIAASDGLEVMLGRTFFAFDAMVDLVIVRAPLPPATVGRPTPNLYCVSLAFRVVRLGRVCGVGSVRVGGRTCDVDALFPAFPLVSPSSSVSWMMTVPPERSLGRDPAEDLLMTRIEGARLGIVVGGRRRGLDVSMRSSIRASDLRFALRP